MNVELQMHERDHLPRLCGADSEPYVAFRFFKSFLAAGTLKLVKE